VLSFAVVAPIFVIQDVLPAEKLIFNINYRFVGIIHFMLRE